MNTRVIAEASWHYHFFLLVLCGTNKSIQLQAMDLPRAIARHKQALHDLRQLLSSELEPVTLKAAESHIDKLESEILAYKPRSTAELLVKLSFYRDHVMSACEHSPVVGAIFSAISQDLQYLLWCNTGRTFSQDDEA